VTTSVAAMKFTTLVWMEIYILCKCECEVVLGFGLCFLLWDDDIQYVILCFLKLSITKRKFMRARWGTRNVFCCLCIMQVLSLILMNCQWWRMKPHLWCSWWSFARRRYLGVEWWKIKIFQRDDLRHEKMNCVIS